MFSLVAIILLFSFLLSLPLVYLFFAKLFSKRIFITILSIPIIWAIVTTITFVQSCSSTQYYIINEKIEPQLGFIILGDRINKLAPQKFINLPLKILCNNGLQFYEVERESAYNNIITYNYMQDNQDKFKTTEQIRSEYALTTEIKRILPLVPVYKIIHRVQRIPDKRIISQASDTVIGGGLIGLYLRAFGGGQDAEYLSYGYASKSLGHWRPNDSSDSRRAQYLAADLEFLLTSLGHVSKEAQTASHK